LVHVASALYLLGPSLALGKRWHQQGCQNPDNGNRHQEFNQGESSGTKST